MSRIDETKQAKLDKRRALEARGINVHPYSFEKNQTIAQAREMMDQEVKTAGRIMSIRAHGKVVFLDLQDSTTLVQVMVRQTDVGDEAFDWLKNLVDRGDFLGVHGTVMTSKTGETTILASHIELMSKALRPIPTAFNAAEDKESRFRKRYLDMLISDKTKKLMDARWLIEKEIRRYLQDQFDFVEVETPILQPLYGGTNATPFTTHMNALDCDFYLRIAPELYLKRLIVGGYDRIFEIARNFRNEGIDQTHQPEFTMIEWYETYADYHRMMNVAEGMIKHLATKLHGQAQIQVGEKFIDISGNWPRLRMDEALLQYKGIDFANLSDQELQKIMTEHKIELKSEFTRGKALFALFDDLVTPHLIEPIWIIDYPRDISPLAKAHRKQPELAERFEAYIGGKELADGWSEIVDAVDQRNIFDNEQKKMRQGDSEAHPLDEDFLEAMEHGMPPLGGIGMGIDRLVMFLTNTWSIKEVIAFPTLRPLNPHIGGANNAGNSSNSAKKASSATTSQNLEGITSDVLEKFPEISYAEVFINNVKIKKSDENLEKLKTEVLNEKKELKIEDIEKLNSIKAYRNMLKGTGTDWHSKRPSPEALLRRIAQGKSLYNINTAVDAYNIAVIQTGIGLGGFDADKLSLPVTLRFSQKNEKMNLLGDKETTSTREGQLVYSDSQHPITIDLNYRDIDETKLTENTKNIALYADGGAGINKDEIISALKQGAIYIQEFCGGEISDINFYDANGKQVISTNHSSDPSKNETTTSSKNNSTSKTESLNLPTRETSEQLLESHVKEPALLNHSRMVARAMEAYAQALGEDSELWYQAGLLHDLDWEEYPDEHPNKALAEWLNDYPQELRDAIAAHGPERTGKEPETLIERYLYACDEICGFINAVSILRPEGFKGMTPKSVKKKLKALNFAANVKREDIKKGLELIGKSEDEHFMFLIKVFEI